MARVREYWTYQKRNVSQPWAIANYVTYTGLHDMPLAWRFDTVIYADWIPNTHSDSSMHNRTYRDAGEFAAAVAATLGKYGHTLHDMDAEQLMHAYNDQISNSYR